MVREQAHAGCGNDLDQFRGIGCTHLLHGMGSVQIDRLLADVERLCDCLTGVAIHDQIDYFAFTRCQARQPVTKAGSMSVVPAVGGIMFQCVVNAVQEVLLSSKFLGKLVLVP